MFVVESESYQIVETSELRMSIGMINETIVREHVEKGLNMKWG